MLSFPEMGASAGLRRQKYSIKRKNFNDKNDKNNIRMRGVVFEMEAPMHSRKGGVSAFYPENVGFMKINGGRAAMGDLHSKQLEQPYFHIKTLNTPN